MKIPSQSGKIAVVTGANSGLGLETARALASSGAHVIMACRDLARGEQARSQLAGNTEVRALDLGSLASVRAFAETLPQQHIDLLINNAGLMATPKGVTQDGFELQIGVNYLGHFALTGALLPKLLAAPSARVVSVSSLQHLQGWLDFEDLHYERRTYHRWKAYAQSKLANLVYAFEFGRRVHRTRIVSVAAHPGYASTPLQSKGEDNADSVIERVALHIGDRVLAQAAAAGAWPQLRAATDPAAQNGDFYGPAWLGMRGPPTHAFASPVAKSKRMGRRLWEVSVALTGATYAQLSG